MNIFTKSSLALKEKSLCFTTSNSAHFGPMAEFVMNGHILEASLSSFAGFKFCLFLPKGQHFTLTLHLKL